MSILGRRDQQTRPDYDSYVRAEWSLFERNPARSEASLDAVGALTVTRVLDIGCGAGQELLPFVVSGNTLGIGLDSAPGVGGVGRELFSQQRLTGRVAFVRGAAEALPYDANGFDVVICRLALPYTRNVRALSEMARVLRPGGLILLKFHHWRYYLATIRKALVAADLRAMLHGARVLVAGTLYHLTGRQPDNRLVGSESFQTEGLLHRELSRLDLALRNVMPGSTPETPSVVLVKSMQRNPGNGPV